jgi:putative endonuclease
LAAHNDLGVKGENIAETHFSGLGYLILERNWRTGKAEVDLIVQKADIIVFAEIKCRSTKAFGAPETSVTNKKQNLLIEAADVYMQGKPEHLNVRFDVVSIIDQGQDYQLNHIEDAFTPSW